MNYFNYYTEIEDAFIRRRGKNLLLSPIDWAMMESWQERGIPLHIVLRGIESVFDNFDKNPRPRTIKSLLFCKEEIEAQFAEWSAAQIGKTEASEKVASVNISKEVILTHIEKCAGAIRNIKAEWMRETADRAASRLNDLAAALTDDAEQTDNALSDIESFLDNAMLSEIDKTHLKQIEKEIAGHLRQYRADMDDQSYKNTFNLMLLKRLREDLGVPRLSLFYL